MYHTDNNYHYASEIVDFRRKKKQTGYLGWLLVPLFVVLIAITSSAVFGQDTKRNQIYEQALPAIVKIYKTDKKGNRYTGSGFIYDKKGSIVTNYHVIRNAKELKIRHLKYNRPYDNIYIVGVDAIRDIALLRPDNFRGFIDSKGNVDAKAAPIARKDVTDEKDIIPIGHPILALTNPASLLKIYTEGMVSGQEDITRIVHERKNILANDERYKVILFTSKIAGGSSGGVLLDTDTGEAVGIAVGAAGKKEFIGFGIPIVYINDLIKSVGDSPEQPLQQFAWSKVERQNDPYYSTALYQWETEEISAHIVSGLVLARDSRPIRQARVQAVGRGEEPHESTLRVLPVDTDEEGRFQFEIPEQTGLSWKVRIDHVGYNTGEFGPIETIEDFPPFYKLSLREDLIRQVLVLEVKPNIVSLELGSKSIFLHSFIRARGARVDKPLRWSLQATDEWVQIRPNKGLANLRGQRIRLKYIENEIPIDEIDEAFTQIGFMAFDNGNEKYAFVELYPNKVPEDDLIFINGHVTTTEGGVPNDAVYITPYIDEKQISNSVQVDDEGYFQFQIPRRFNHKIVKLQVKATLFFVREDHPSLSINLTKKRDTIIIMSPIQKWGGSNDISTF